MWFFWSWEFLFDFLGLKLCLAVNQITFKKKKKRKIVEGLHFLMELNFFWDLGGEIRYIWIDQVREANWFLASQKKKIIKNNKQTNKPKGDKP